MYIYIFIFSGLFYLHVGAEEAVKKQNLICSENTCGNKLTLNHFAPHQTFKNYIEIFPPAIGENFQKPGGKISFPWYLTKFYHLASTACITKSLSISIMFKAQKFCSAHMCCFHSLTSHTSHPNVLRNQF